MATINIEHERDEQWAWPKGMEDKEYGPFVPGVTRGREPHGGGKWHVTVKARLQVHGLVYGRQYMWIDSGGNEPSEQWLAAIWAELDRQVLEDYHANRAAGWRPIKPPIDLDKVGGVPDADGQ